MHMPARVPCARVGPADTSEGLLMVRSRISLEDDHGHESHGDPQHLESLSGGTQGLVDLEAVVEGLKQAAFPERMAECMTLAQSQGVTEEKKGAWRW